MKQDSIKKQLKTLGIKSKSKEKDGKLFFRLRELRDVGLEKLLQKIGAAAVEKTEKGFFIPKSDRTLKKIIAALSPKTAVERTTEKADTETELKKFSETLKLVNIRAGAMQKACAVQPSTTCRWRHGWFRRPASSPA